MKIQGTNLPKLNAYKQQLQKPAHRQQEANRNDQINISNEAKQLQESSITNLRRSEYIQEIKRAVEAGEYTINVEKTAQKMIDFWSTRI
ncbi:flagellar biosynthesis anti-sigma factor FlgM [Virgibacillus sp. W0430]|uniref:flagellar biosynthesis anti-sigma factor FlgM n=1 Tax=Virgibacillus sp. W0430 TaxID=3391580 RepID=UPI003F4489DD